jgi:hypothetical protein
MPPQVSTTSQIIDTSDALNRRPQNCTAPILSMPLSFRYDLLIAEQRPVVRKRMMASA